MNEFAKTTPDTAMKTHGVSVCTALTVVLSGRFGYLAHIGPTDRIYGKPDLGHNDCLRDMLSRLQRYDVYACEMPELEFTIIAAHRASFVAAIDRLLDFGVELAQIRFAYSAEAEYANVTLSSAGGPVFVEWIDSADDTTTIVATDVESLGNIVRVIAERRR